MDFEARKLGCLRAMASSLPDKSRKGTIDTLIAPLVARINAHPAFFTTSSCSGRISISQELQSPLHPGHIPSHTTPTRRKMKGGDWNFVSHSPIDAQEVLQTLSDCFARNETQQPQLGLMVFRFEPFILAVECLTLSHAQALVSCAIASGFRESGVTSMRKRIIVAVRCSIRIEAPIAEAGHLMVSEDYLKFLVRIANEKMGINHRRTEKFLSAFIDQLERPTTDARGSSIVSIGQEMPGPDSVHEEAKKRCSQEQKSEAKILEPMRRKLAELEKRQTRVLSRIQVVEALLRDSIPELCESSDDASLVVLKGGMIVDGLSPEAEVSIDSRIRGMDAMLAPDVLPNDRCADLHKTDVPLKLECARLPTSNQRADHNCYDVEGKGW